MKYKHIYWSRISKDDTECEIIVYKFNAIYYAQSLASEYKHIIFNKIRLLREDEL